jgi:hypothetical protein
MKATLERVLEAFDVDIETGHITWRISQGRVAAGSKAGRLHSYGYQTVNLDGKSYGVHSIVFLVATGRWPSLIDHINGQRSDNRICNLREADRATNARNRTNWVGKKLLGAIKNGKKWRATIHDKGRLFNLGTYSTEIEAHNQYKSVRQKIDAAEAAARIAVLEQVQADQQIRRSA